MPNVSEMTLYDWLTSSHPTMPYIVIEEDELRSLVAYILSLKRKGP